MAAKRDDLLQSVSVRLDGKNYLYWSYVMRIFFKGKKKCGYVSGTYVVPKNTKKGDGKQTMLRLLLGFTIPLSIL